MSILGDVNQTSRDNENRDREYERSVSYKSIIDEIANSGTLYEANQKASMYAEQLAEFKEFGINVDKDLSNIYNNLEKTKLKGISFKTDYAPVPDKVKTQAQTSVAPNIKPDVAEINAETRRAPGIELKDTFNSLKSQVMEKASEQFRLRDDNRFDYSYKFIGKYIGKPKVQVFIGGNEVDSSSFSVQWDSAMGYIHGLAGAQGAYYNRSDDYKFSWNLANNAMRTLADAFGKVAETAPPVLPGRGPMPRMELATAGTVARTQTMTAPLTSIYFSSAGGNDKNTSHSKGSIKAEGVLQNINTRNVVTRTAEETNQWWKAKGLDKPPVREGTKVMEAELREETSGFVRVYDDVNSFQKGGWLMRKEDIIGLTPEQIKDKFALKHVPKYVTDVKLPADTRIRISEANEIPGWGKGGGTQIDLLDERVGEFFNPRSLEGKWW